MKTLIAYQLVLDGEVIETLFPEQIPYSDVQAIAMAQGSEIIELTR